jgi:hypothetical protein
VNTAKSAGKVRGALRVSAQRDFFRLQKPTANSKNEIANHTLKRGVCLMLAWLRKRPQISSGYGIIVIGSYIH